MAEDKKPGKPKSTLRKEFREFSFPDAPLPQQPAQLKPEDAYPGPRRIPITGGDDGPQDIPVHGAANDDDTEWSLEFEEEQRRVQEAAYSFLPRRPEIQNAIELAARLDIEGVIAAGVIEEHFRGVLDDDEVDSYAAAALLVDAPNFDRISKSFSPLAVAIVDEIRMAEDEKVFEDMLANLGSMEPETKRVYMATQIAQMEAVQQDIRAGIEPPEQEYHEDMGAMIAAAAPGTDSSLVRRAVSIFNEVSVESGYLTTLRMDKKGVVEMLDSPGLVVQKPKKPQPQKPRPKNPGKKKPPAGPKPH